MGPRTRITNCADADRDFRQQTGGDAFATSITATQLVDYCLLPIIESIKVIVAPWFMFVDSQNSKESTCHQSVASVP